MMELRFDCEVEIVDQGVEDGWKKIAIIFPDW
jgi:hypothetical protein